MRSVWRFLAWLLDMYVLVSNKIASLLSDLSEYPGLGVLNPVAKVIRWPLTFIPPIQTWFRRAQLQIVTTRSKAKSLGSAVRKLGKH